MNIVNILHSNVSFVNIKMTQSRILRMTQSHIRKMTQSRSFHGPSPDHQLGLTRLTHPHPVNTARYHHGNLRTALLEAGLRIAEADGPAALQLRDLARAEGVSASAVYRHFPDLAHLSAEVGRLARRRLARAMLHAADAVPAEPDAGLHAIRRFDAIGRAYVEFAVRHPKLFDTAFQAPTAPPSCADDPSAWAVLESALERLVSVGELSAQRRIDAPIVSWSAVHGLAGILVRGMLVPPATAADAIAAVLRGVRRSLELRDG
ncbi:MAG: TetR/AcrR family transcriptional regulator [Gemmatimonadaceae bacterium]|nr:TetR/AcrR family transcriptional regulator [Gemmatimonadaceae bacterium]